MNRKIFILGLDGATFGIIKPLCKKGLLPRFDQLMRDSCKGVLMSTIPPSTIPAWDTLITGKNPGKLGIFDFFYRDDGSYDIMRVDSRLRKDPPLWKILSAYGKKVVVFNVPTTFPPDEVNGVMVSGRGALEDKDYTYPPELKRTLNELVGGYRISPNRNFTYEDVLNLTEKQCRVVEYFLDKLEWDFFMAVFTGLDLVCHSRWGGKEVEKIYVVMDDVLGGILERLDEETDFCIISDHGFGEPGRSFWVNTWLQQEGFLVVKENKTFWKKHILAGAKELVKSILIKLGMINVAYKVIPQRVIFALPSASKPNINEVDIDWDSTIAYSIYGNMPRIFLNVRGREPRGSVPFSDYVKTRDMIIERLRNIDDSDTGEKVNITIYKKEDIYHGGDLTKAPDLLFSFNGFKDSHMIPYLYGEKIFTRNQANFGWHRPEGIFILRGSDIVPKNIGSLSLVDIAPTILHLLSLPIPADMDGRVLTEIFKAGSSAEREVIYSGATRKDEKGKPVEWKEVDEWEIRERLRKLGYLG
jgi:predicted AlkP superfamily phosphohydrolase/phosphomutase